MSPTSDVAARYGKRSGGSRKKRTVFLAVVAVLLVAGVGWSWWVAQGQTTKPSAKVVSYDVRSSHAILVTIQAHRPDGAATRCTVYAQAKDFAVVGERRVTLAKGKDDVTIRTTVRTDRRAVTGLVKDCTALE